MSSETHHANFRSRVLSAALWNYLGTLVRVVMQLTTMVLLARIVGPDEFGVYVIVNITVVLAALLADCGMGNALVQLPDPPTRRLLARVSVLLCIAVLLVTMALLPLAPWITAFFSDVSRPETVAHGIRLGCLYLVFTAASIIPLSALRRALRMREVQSAYLLSYFFGFSVIGIFGAMLDFGALALIGALVAQAAIQAGLAWFYALPISYGLSSKHEGYGFWTYGFRTILNNLANWVTANIDNVLVGRFHGKSSLALYTVSYNLVRAPTNHVVVALQGVLFSASARQAENIAALREMFLGVAAIVFFITSCMFFSVAVVAEALVIFLYGQDWVGAADVLTPLALAMPFQALVAIAGPVASGVGRVDLELKVQLSTAIALAAALLAASSFSIVVMGWVVFAVYVFRALAILAVVCHLISLDYSKLARVIGVCAIPAVSMGLFLSLLDHVVLPILGLSTFALLSAETVAALVMLSLAWGLCGSKILPRESFRIVNDLGVRIPRPLGKFLMAGA